MQAKVLNSVEFVNQTAFMMANNNARVLIADDQRDVLEALKLLLKAEGFSIHTASSPAGVLDSLQSREFDAVVLDLNYAREATSGQGGLDLLRGTRAVDG